LFLSNFISIKCVKTNFQSNMCRQKLSDAQLNKENELATLKNENANLEQKLSASSKVCSLILLHRILDAIKQSTIKQFLIM